MRNQPDIIDQVICGDSAEYCDKIIRPRLLATNPALFA